MRASSYASLIALSLLAFGCSSSPNVVEVPDETGGSANTGGVTGGSGGAKADASRTGGGTGTGGKTGAGGSTGVAGQPPGPLTYTDASAPMPAASWTNVTNNLAGLPSECGNAAAVYASPWYDMLVTGIATGGSETQGLFASNDGGASWTKIGTGSGSTITYRMTVVLFDPEKPNTWWVSGIYGWENPWCEGADITEDNGNSFLGYWDMGAQKQSHNDSISVDFTDPLRLTMLSGGHEQKPSGGQGVFLSTDGSSFVDIASSLPALNLGFCTNTLVVSKDNLLVGCSGGWGGGVGSILRSTDVGNSWTQVSTESVNGQPLLHSDGSIYWAVGGGILKSADHGVSWSIVAASSKAGGRAIELPDKRIAAVANKIIVVSGDGGVTWKNATTAIPFDSNGITYNKFRKAFYTSHGDCTGTTPSDAYAGFGWDYTAN
jgi:hypothetical protein